MLEDLAGRGVWRVAGGGPTWAGCVEGGGEHTAAGEQKEDAPQRAWPPRHHHTTPVMTDIWLHIQYMGSGNTQASCSPPTLTINGLASLRPPNQVLLTLLMLLMFWLHVGIRASTRPAKRGSALRLVRWYPPSSARL